MGQRFAPDGLHRRRSVLCFAADCRAGPSPSPCSGTLVQALFSSACHSRVSSAPSEPVIPARRAPPSLFDSAAAALHSARPAQAAFHPLLLVLLVLLLLLAAAGSPAARRPFPTMPIHPSAPSWALPALPPPQEKPASPPTPIEADGCKRQVGSGTPSPRTAQDGSQSNKTLRARCRRIAASCSPSSHNLPPPRPSQPSPHSTEFFKVIRSKARRFIFSPYI